MSGPALNSHEVQEKPICIGDYREGGRKIHQYHNVHVEPIGSQLDHPLGLRCQIREVRRQHRRGNLRLHRHRGWNPAETEDGVDGRLNWQTADGSRFVRKLFGRWRWEECEDIWESTARRLDRVKIWTDGGPPKCDQIDNCLGQNGMCCAVQSMVKRIIKFFY